MRNWVAAGVVVGIVGSVLGGCSSSSGPTTPSDFCSEKANEECRYVVPVCQLLTSTACVEARTNVCMTDATNALKSGNRVFTPGAVSACIAAIDGVYGALSFGHNTTLAFSDFNGGPTDTSSPDYLCEAVFQGDRKSTQTCTSDFDCAGGNICTPATFGGKTAVCAPLNPVSDGMPCGAAGDVCVPGDVCKANQNGEPVCQASSASLGGIGAPCKSDANCDPGTAGYCDPNANNTCQQGYSFGGGQDCKAFGGK